MFMFKEPNELAGGFALCRYQAAPSAPSTVGCFFGVYVWGLVLKLSRPHLVQVQGCAAACWLDFYLAYDAARRLTAHLCLCHHVSRSSHVPATIDQMALVSAIPVRSKLDAMIQCTC